MVVAEADATVATIVVVDTVVEAIVVVVAAADDTIDHHLVTGMIGIETLEVGTDTTIVEVAEAVVKTLDAIDPPSTAEMVAVVVDTADALPSEAEEVRAMVVAAAARDLVPHLVTVMTVAAVGTTGTAVAVLGMKIAIATTTILAAVVAAEVDVIATTMGEEEMLDVVALRTCIAEHATIADTVVRLTRAKLQPPTKLSKEKNKKYYVDTKGLISAAVCVSPLERQKCIMSNHS